MNQLRKLSEVNGVMFAGTINFNLMLCSDIIFLKCRTTE